MPQSTVFPASPGFGSQLGQALGGGFGQGFQQGISSRLNSMLERKKDFGKLDKATKAAYGPDWPIEPEQQLEAIKRSREYFNQGYSLQDAVLQSRFHDELQALQRPPTEQEQPTSALKPKEKQSLARQLGGDPREVGAEIKKFGQKAAYPFVQLYDTLRQQFSPNAAAEQQLRQQGFTPEQIAQSREQIQGALPGPLQGGAPQPVTPAYLQATGGVGPGENILERAGQAYLIGGAPGVVGELVGEGAQALGASPEQQEAAEVIGFIGALAFGKIKSTVKKAGQKIFSNAEKAAAQSGQSLEQVIATAQKESGANLQKAISGDANELNKLNRSISKEAPKLAEKVKETPKTVFHKEAAIKQREKITPERLKKSPYEAYYEIEAEKAAKEAKKTPATLAKEAEITKSVKPLETAKMRELETQRQQLRDLERDVKKLEGNEKARVETTIGYKQREIQKTLDELRDLRYELKYFKKRPTDAQVEAQVRKSAEEFIEEARNPTEAGQKGLKRQIDLDKQYLERAEELLKHGEIPGEFRPDTFLRMHEKYLEGYKAVVGELKEANKALRGARDTESLKTIADNKKAIESLENRIARQKADIVNQTDKIKALKAVEGPSGSFYRQQLKEMRKDIAQFQHDAIKVPKVKGPSQMKAEKVGQKEINEIGRLANETRKTPSPENLEKIAEKSGVSKQDFKSTLDETKKLIKEGKSEKEIVSSMGDKVEDIFQKARKKPIKDRIYKITTGFLTLPWIIKAGVFALSGGEFHTLNQFLRERTRKGDVEKYGSARDSIERQRIINEFRAKGYNRARINGIIQASRSQKKLEAE